MTTKNKPPLWFWITTIVLVLWEAMGCYACFTQIKLGAAAWGPIDDWAIKYFAALPRWYNWVYVVATLSGLLGGLVLLLRDKRSVLLFWISLAAVILMFGYAFAATDLIAHKGAMNVVPFPMLIAAVGAFSISAFPIRREKGLARPLSSAAAREATDALVAKEPQGATRARLFGEARRPVSWGRHGGVSSTQILPSSPLGRGRRGRLPPVPVVRNRAPRRNRLRSRRTTRSRDPPSSRPCRR